MTEHKKKSRKAKKVQSALTHVRLRDVSPMTKTQHKVFKSYGEGQNLFLHGCPGTGKTFLGLFLALSDLKNGHADKLIIIRSAVSTREQGFLPGTLDEKMSVYETPYADICNNLLQRNDAYDMLKTTNVITFMTTSFVRGLTFKNAIVLLDEIQNYTDHEISSILTRIGDGCRVIICGDLFQNDLGIQKKKEDTGIVNLFQITKKMKEFDLIEFTVNDIVRSGFVKNYIIARLQLDKKLL